MSLTFSQDAYSDDAGHHDRLRSDEPFTPVYARTARSRSKGGLKTWMILAPIGVLTLGVVGAAALMGAQDDTAATVEAETATPAAVAAPMIQAPLASGGVNTATVEPAATATAPVARVQPTPAPRPPASASTQSVASARPAPATSATPAEAVAEPTGPQPYRPAAAPFTVTPAAPPAPQIVVEPLAD